MPPLARASSHVAGAPVARLENDTNNPVQAYTAPASPARKPPPRALNALNALNMWRLLRVAVFTPISAVVPGSPRSSKRVASLDSTPGPAARAWGALDHAGQPAPAALALAIHAPSGALQSDAVGTLLRQIGVRLGFSGASCPAPLPLADEAPAWRCQLAALATRYEGAAELDMAQTAELSDVLDQLALQFGGCAPVAGVPYRQSSEHDPVLAKLLPLFQGQVLGAWAKLARPILHAAIRENRSAYGAAGAMSISHPVVLPLIAGHYLRARGKATEQDLSIRETQKNIVRIGHDVGLNLLFLEAKVGAQVVRTSGQGREYANVEQYVQADGSQARRRRMSLPRLTDLARRGGDTGWLSRRSGLSLKDLDKLEARADDERHRFAEAAAMVATDSVLHLSAPARRERTSADALYSSTDLLLRVRARLKAGAMLPSVGILPEIWSGLGASVHVAGELGVGRQRFNRSTSISFVDALRGVRGLDRDEALAVLRNEAPRVGPALAALARQRDFVLEHCQQPETLASLVATMKAQWDLYCQSIGTARLDARALEPARAIENLWNVRGEHVQYACLQAFSVALALIDARLGELGRPDEPAVNELAKTLAAPPMLHDPQLLSDATGYRREEQADSLLAEAMFSIGAMVEVPRARDTGPTGGIEVKARLTQSNHFDTLRSGAYIDLSIGVGAWGELDLQTVLQPVLGAAQAAGPALQAALDGVQGWVRDMAASLTPESLAASDLTVNLGPQLMRLLSSNIPLGKSGASNAVNVRFFRPAGRHDGAAAGKRPFRLQYVRAERTRMILGDDLKVRPLGEIWGAQTLSYVLPVLQRQGVASGTGAPLDAFLAAGRDALSNMFINLAQADSAIAREANALWQQCLDHAADAGPRADLARRHKRFSDAMNGYATAMARVGSKGEQDGAGHVAALTACAPDAYPLALEALRDLARAHAVPSEAARVAAARYRLVVERFD